MELNRWCGLLLINQLRPQAVNRRSGYRSTWSFTVIHSRENHDIIISLISINISLVIFQIPKPQGREVVKREKMLPAPGWLTPLFSTDGTSLPCSGLLLPSSGLLLPCSEQAPTDSGQPTNGRLEDIKRKDIAADGWALDMGMREVIESKNHPIWQPWDINFVCYFVFPYSWSYFEFKFIFSLLKSLPITFIKRQW